MPPNRLIQLNGAKLELTLTPSLGMSLDLGGLQPALELSLHVFASLAQVAQIPNQLNRPRCQVRHLPAMLLRRPPTANPVDDLEYLTRRRTLTGSDRDPLEFGGQGLVVGGRAAEVGLEGGLSGVAGVAEEAEVGRVVASASTAGYNV